jgi:hypothetical protein
MHNRRQSSTGKKRDATAGVRSSPSDLPLPTATYGVASSSSAMAEGGRARLVVARRELVPVGAEGGGTSELGGAGEGGRRAGG